MLNILFAAVAASGIRVGFTLGIGIVDSDVQADPANAGAGVIVDSDGSIRTYSDSTAAGNWIMPQDAAGSITVHAMLSGSGTGVPNEGGLDLDTWYELNTDRSWHFVRETVGTESFTGTLSLSVDGGSTTLDTISVSLEAEVV